MATIKSDERAGEEIFESTQLKFLPLKYENRISIMAVTRQSAYFVHIQIGAKDNITHLVACLLDTETQKTFISKDFLLTDWLPTISKEVLPSVLSASKDRIKTKCSITVHVGSDQLLTNVLFRVVENVAIDELIRAAFSDEHLSPI